jgi:hypothetical protein
MRPRSTGGQGRLVLLSLLAVAPAACKVSDGVLGALVGEGPALDGGVPAAGCGLASPVVTVAGQNTCTGRLAATTFSNALCTCGDLQLGASLTTRGFDSRQGPYQTGGPGPSGAAVAVNGNYSLAVGATDIGGSFSVAGGGALQFMGSLVVYGDLYFAGDLSVTGGTTVSRNAWLAGNYSGLGVLTVGGDLHHAGTVPALSIVAGSNQQQPVTVAKPCPCGAAEILDVGALVDAARAKNDNSRLAISPDAFAEVSGSVSWTLSCGQVYLSRIGGVGSLVIRVTGVAAVFVEGSLDLVGSLSFEIAPGAEVDVFVKQDLAVQGTVALASKDRPAAGRMWVGGTGPITVASPWIGNLYAPRARLGATVGLEVWGSVFVANLAGGAYGNFVFDRAVAAAGASCAAPRPPAGVCARCTWCSGGEACVAGSCGACRSDSDCCGLAVCFNGSCQALIDTTAE